MVERVVYRRRLSYNTPSNRSKIIRAPGGHLICQHQKKLKRVPKCGQCKTKLKGIRPARSFEKSRLSLRLKTVKRPYGGVLCHKCVREKILRAFLIEEQKIVVKVLKAQNKAQKHKKPKKFAKAATTTAPPTTTGKPGKSGKGGAK